MTELGNLIPVPIREVWSSEDEDFTPWVASKAGLTLLSDYLGLTLESAQSEVEVGQFRADVVCNHASDDGTTTKVVIENQLGLSDHEHLGQLMVYVASANAGIGIWIAGEFTTEHRKAVERLNDSPSGHPRYFCVELGAWCIGDSTVAPAFSVIVKPGDWSRASVPAPPAKNNGHLRRFWARLNQRLADAGMPQSRTSKWRNYQRFDLPHQGVSLSVVRDRSRNRARLYMWRSGHQNLFRQLEAHRSSIEHELGVSTDWKSDNFRSSIDLSIDSHLFDESKWDCEIEWMIGRLARLRAVFEPRLRELASDAPEVEAESLAA